ncbi:MULTISPECIES: type III secretion system gatekeeper subunit SctW [unclassified Brenneria]|uniref:type III secretion system gatekeeper subunit SctW n=1 Tax=unclassified Brenneria TaxID=2634434 RepID=UPI0015532D9F|nr:MULTISPECIES: type III secretion system gatekeeper subunit SctW [unclassified Brenneria]MBJ7220896.1 type III secretion system gatekeeper subunit SctW [Brenneria sp. L3-3C-1]MEE3642137.1 type III secretion system gatekeeper subunit SctW [Brenneria sp. L3_3C_1]MEE3650490.1 type III secretion system gatekeeper subunit SctW [Brenneria sp. HEZEL_4_2_4]NPD00446.1 type III secretion system gatekeeper subunit SctW [Brenneria sp. hezel4-2-4]
MIKIPGVLPPTTPLTRQITSDDEPAAAATPKATAQHAPLHAPLSTSMEEIAMAFGEHAERRSKSLNRRHISQPEGHTTASVERIEKLTELFRMLENPSQSTLDEQLGRMRNLLMRETPPTLDDILQAAGNDPARGDILLRHVLSQAQEQPALAAVAEQALQTLHQAKGPEVRAGLNTAAAISLFSTQPEQKQAMRDLYYQKIVHQQSASALLDSLLERFDSKTFSIGLRTLQRALAADIASLAPSISKTVLSKMLSNLNDAQHLSHTLSSSQALLARLETKLPAFTLGAVDLTRRLIGLSANGAYARDLHNLGREVAGTQPHHQTLFFNGLLPLVSQLPQPLWRDVKNRQTALQIIRGLIGEFAQYEKQQAAHSPGKGSA